jgi:dipeptidyl aminopeptidase/acylaminoacyl peptidase
VNKVDIKDIFKIKSVASPKVVPESQAVTYLVTQIDEEKNDYTTHLYKYEHADSVQLTYKGERISNVEHTKDGRTSLFISKGDNDKSQVFLLRAAGGERDQLTHEEDGVNSAFFSNDGRKVYYHVSSLLEKKEDTDKDKNEKDMPKPVIVDRMKYKADSVGLLEEKYQAVKVIDVQTNKAETLLSGKENYELHNVLGEDTLLYTTDRSDDPDFNFSEELYKKTGTKESVQLPTEGGGVLKVDVSPSEQYLLLTETSRAYENATHGVVYLYDLETGEKKNLTGHLDKPVGDYAAQDTQQSVDSNPTKWISKDTFLFVLSENGSVNLYKGNISGEITPIYRGHHYVYGMDADATHAYITVSTPTHPGELYKIDLETHEAVRLTAHNKFYVENTQLVEPEDITYKSEDGTTIHGWLMKPAGFKADVKYPLITNIHGGPHAFYANSFFHEMQVFAGLGYGVLYVNPRGSHSYSQAFVDAVRGDYGNGDYKDIMAGVDYVLEEYDWIDEDNLGVTGGSYGGFMTNWIVGHTNRFKAAVTQRSICNWVSFRGVSDIGYYFSDWQIKAELNDVETMWHHSPIKYVDDIETPLLILHSERDFRCPIEQGEQLYVALKYQKKETQFVRFPEADHNLSRTGKPNLRVERLTHLTGWFETHLDKKHE